jgi:hypothetical protein
MTMTRARLAAALAAMTCCLGAAGTAASEAQATQWVTHAGIEGGSNFFGPSVTLFASETVGYGVGLGCAGIRGISGVMCEQTPGEFVAIIIENSVKSEPYIHNHSTFKSFFDGFYY